MSRGAVYYLPRPVSDVDLAVMRRLDELHLEHPFMGARMLRDQLARQGIHVGRRHVGTLMQRMGITALAPQPGGGIGQCTAGGARHDGRAAHRVRPDPHQHRRHPVTETPAFYEEEHEEFRGVAREFTTREVAPVVSRA